MLVGDGPTTYDGTSLQPNNQKDLFAVDLSTGSLVGSFTTGDAQAFMGMPITVDIDLDYRVDIAYAGTVQCNKDPSNSDGDNNRCTGTNTPTWSGALYRLTTTGCANAPCTTAGWGGTTHGPTVVLAQFPLASPQPVGPITVAPTAAMDDSNQLWVMFGSGRYYGIADKTDAQQQYFFGVKDPVPLGGCTQTSTTNCERRDLVNTSDVVVCSVCTGSTNQVTSSLAGVISVEGSTTTSLQGLIKTKQGWYTTLPAQRERLVSSPIILGGILFFPSFVPGNDACSAAGEGYLYALFYQTGSAPKDPVIGTTTSGSNTVVNRALDLGEGVPSQMAVQIGAQGTDASGGGTGQGCQQQVTLVNQSSTGATNQVCGGTRFAAWSRMVSWNVQRD
jgi:type IV pilus assembly protein PilY1